MDRCVTKLVGAGDTFWPSRAPLIPVAGYVRGMNVYKNTQHESNSLADFRFCR
jgi:hypothetical protein